MDRRHRRIVSDDANPKIAETASVNGGVADVAYVGVENTSFRGSGISVARFFCSAARHVFVTRLLADVGMPQSYGVERVTGRARAARCFGSGILWRSRFLAMVCEPGFSKPSGDVCRRPSRPAKRTLFSDASKRAIGGYC